MVLEKTLESPLDCKEIQTVHSKGDQPWVFFGRNDAEAETPVLKTLMLEGVGGRRRRGQQRIRWLDGVGDGQGGLACCYSWGCKESDMTEQLN